MSIDLAAATAFMATHARILDQRRFSLLTGHGDPHATLAALEAYRNPDGGYGWGLEPDLRSTNSQPGPALHAFEVFEEVAPVTTTRAVQLCDWLASVTLPDGGLPFALPFSDTAGSAVWWTQPDQAESSLQITSVVAATAHRAAAHDPAVAAHPWLSQATEYCLNAVKAIDETPHALVLSFAMRFLDAIHGTHPEAEGLIDRLGRFIPDDGLMHVGGGTEDEYMRPLDFSPFPDGPARRLFAPEVIDAELRRLAELQQDDGGWPWEPATFSPASTLEWRGAITVESVSVLQRHAKI